MERRGVFAPTFGNEGKSGPYWEPVIGSELRRKVWCFWPAHMGTWVASMSIVSWLEKHGLDQYSEAFVGNDVDLDILPHLTEEHLEKLGVSLGHRVKILKALAEEVIDTGAVELDAESAGQSLALPASRAERRQLTVMFCDLVGSTALSESMDPEQYREVLAAYQSAAKKAIEAYEGYIARYMGDGLLMYFGYPQAHEEDPERAVRAGLDLVDAVGALKACGGIELKVRIGVATGLVVAGDIVGEGSSEERAVLGDTPNLAARLQGLAAPNEILVAEGTKRLIQGRFEIAPTGAHRLKGIGNPVAVFRVKSVLEATRFEAASAAGLGRFLGRDEEIGMLAVCRTLGRKTM